MSAVDGRPEDADSTIYGWKSSDWKSRSRMRLCSDRPEKAERIVFEADAQRYRVANERLKTEFSHFKTLYEQ